MEYERALFRVYDKSMEGFHSPGVRSACNLAQKFFLVASAGLFATLVLLHHQFVNNPGCLAPLLEAAALREGLLLLPADLPSSSSSSSGAGAKSGIASVTANNTLGEIDVDADGIIGPSGTGGDDEEGRQENQEEGEEEEEEEEEEDNHPTRIQLPSGNWLPFDIMVGVSIGGGGDGSGSRGRRRWWGLRGAANDEGEEGGDEGSGRRIADAEGGGGGEGAEGGGVEVGAAAAAETASESATSAGGSEGNFDGNSIGSSSAAEAAAGTSPAPVNGTGFEADYTFAFEPIVLLLPEKLQDSHSFKWVNFTLEPSVCLHEAGFVSRLLAATVVGYDEIMVNMFMFSMRSKGLLKNTQTGGEWMWARESKSPSGFVQVLSTLAFKCQVVVRSLVAFVLMSTVTALTVRTLLSSGVVIMFPMVMLLERMGLQGVDMNEMLALSYPWLGLPIEHLRNQNKPIAPFIMGHIMQMVVFYTVYNACLLAWSYWLYGKTMTTSLQVWLYGMVMLYEYFALIFVRARSSIVFFSRTAALSFVAFHVYFYHFQMGFFGLAAWSGFFGMFAVKLYVLQAIELPAYTTGEVSHDAPRAHFVELPWPTWGAALPPMWSLFIPPNASAGRVYEDTVPDRPDGAGAGGGGGGGAVAVGGTAAAEGVGAAGRQGRGEAVRIPPARGAAEPRGGARARGRGRARARGGTRSEQERPLVGGDRDDGRGGGGEDIEMTPRRRRRNGGEAGEMEEG